MIGPNLKESPLMEVNIKSCANPIGLNITGNFNDTASTINHKTPNCAKVWKNVL